MGATNYNSAGTERLTALEEKIRRTAELCRELRREKSDLHKEIAGLRLQIETLTDDKRLLESRIDHLIVGRREIRERVEAMLDAIATLEMEAESIK